MPENKNQSSKSLKLKNQISRLKNQINQKLKDLQEIHEGRLCFPFLDVEITRSVVDDIFDDLRKKYQKCNGHLDVLIDSGGGDIDSAYNLSMLFRKFGSEELNFIIPRWAKSAATLLVCSGDKIFMSPVAELGPLDPQITQMNLLEGRLEQFSPLHIGSTLDMIRKEFESGSEKLANGLIERLQFPITLGGFLKLLEVGEQYLNKLLETRMLLNSEEKSKSESIAKRLTTGYADHGFCINIDEAKDLGLAVFDIPEEELKIVWGLHRLNDKRRKIQNEMQKDKVLDMIKELPPDLLDKLPKPLRKKLNQVKSTRKEEE